MARRGDAISTRNGVYRTPGREADDAPVALPSRRALLSPLARAAMCVLALVTPPVLFNLCLAAQELRFRPSLESIQDVIALSLIASVGVLVHRIVRRVRPIWGGLRMHSKVLYVAALLVVQSVLVVGAELVLFESRGGLHLFEPTYRTSAPLPDSRTAYIYEGGFLCNYDVYVAAPFSPTMKHALHVSRRMCEPTPPRVQSKEDGSIQLVDRDGKPLESETSDLFFGWTGGC